MNERHRGDERDVGIVMQGGLWNTTLRGLHVLGLADTRGRTAIPLLVLNAIHPLVPDELVGFLRGKRRVLVVEEGMPNYIERELGALAHDAKLDVEIHGKDVFSPHGEYVPQLVIGGLPRFPFEAGVPAPQGGGGGPAAPPPPPPPGAGGAAPAPARRPAPPAALSDV